MSTDTDTDTDTDNDRFVEQDEEIQKRRKGIAPNRRLSHNQRLRKAVEDWSSDSEEVRGAAPASQRRRAGGRGDLASQKKEKEEKEDWALLSDDPDKEPITVHSPYYESRKR